jgi:hypothetical protein
VPSEPRDVEPRAPSLVQHAACWWPAWHVADDAPGEVATYPKRTDDARVGPVVAAYGGGRRSHRAARETEPT